MARTLKALVVDDEPHLRTYLKLLLKRVGFSQIEVAEDGRGAVAQYQQHRPDLVLMDLNMPVMDGTEALGAILEIDAQAVVIMMTATASSDVADKCLSLGAASYIRKDSRREEITDALQAMVAEKLTDTPGPGQAERSG